MHWKLLTPCQFVPGTGTWGRWDRWSSCWTLTRAACDLSWMPGMRRLEAVAAGNARPVGRVRLRLHPARLSGVTGRGRREHANVHRCWPQFLAAPHTCQASCLRQSRSAAASIDGKGASARREGDAFGPIRPAHRRKRKPRDLLPVPRRCRLVPQACGPCG